MERFVTAIFVPHAGCPHRCSFCDQNAISDTSNLPSPEQAAKIAQTALGDLIKRRAAQPGLPAEIAFFGGSFTALPRAQMTALLEAAQPFLGEGKFDGVRLSTRPDAMDEETAKLLKEYRVDCVELGAQSSDGLVLTANLRGHTYADTVKAAAAVKAAGLRLGLQMMTGLYRSDSQKDLKTAYDLLSLRPDFMRVYPTAVFENTLLYRLFKEGEYRPQSVAEAVAVCSKILRAARAAGVPIVRLGLHADFAPDSRPVAGAFHPAFGQLCESRIFREDLEKSIEKKPRGGYTVLVARSGVSDAVGNRRENLGYFDGLGYRLRIETADGLARGEFIIKENG